MHPMLPYRWGSGSAVPPVPLPCCLTTPASSADRALALATEDRSGARAASACARQLAARTERVVLWTTAVMVVDAPVVSPHPLGMTKGRENAIDEGDDNDEDDYPPPTRHARCPVIGHGHREICSP
jgi:hypothetical protein